VAQHKHTKISREDTRTHTQTRTTHHNKEQKKLDILVIHHLN